MTSEAGGPEFRRTKERFGVMPQGQGEARAAWNVS